MEIRKWDFIIQELNRSESRLVTVDLVGGDVECWLLDGAGV